MSEQFPESPRMDPAADAADQTAAAAPPAPADSSPVPSVTATERALAAVGRWLVGTGRFVGRSAAAAYRAVDPDVRRHVAQWPLLSYSLLGARRERVEAGEPDGHPPLIFVHGLGGSRGDFMLMAQYLRLHGRKRSYRVHLDGGQTLSELATALGQFVRAVHEATGEPQVELVAHSLGGLVVRLMLLEQADVVERIRTVITMGTPHNGTYPARFADTVITRELRPDSPLIGRLAATPWPRQVRGVTFWSKSDMLVLPPESAALDGTHQLEVTPFTHYSYLIDPRSWALVRRELELAGGED